jgi:hypothetical protein
MTVGKLQPMFPLRDLAKPAGHLVIFAFCAALVLSGATNASAQMGFTGPAGGATFAPPPPSPNAPSASPQGAHTSPLPQPAPPKQAPRDPHVFMPTVQAGKVALGVAARYSEGGALVQRVLTWRVYNEKSPDGMPSLAAEAQDAFPVFALPPGKYIVHVSYGLASAAQQIELKSDPKKLTLVLPVGGLRVQGVVGDHVIPPARLHFDVFEGSFLQRGIVKKRTRSQGDRPPILRGAIGGDVVLLPAGTYYIQSTYGEGNAQIQADVRIEAGRLTDATVHHRAARVTLRLVNAPGGEAIANTQWSVLTPGGDSIKESIGAFPTVVLAEGEYVAVARSSDKTFQQNFKVESGNDREIEVLAH